MIQLNGIKIIKRLVKLKILLFGKDGQVGKHIYDLIKKNL